MRHGQKSDAKVPGKSRDDEKISPSMGKGRRLSPGVAWTGFIGINESSYDGLKRSGRFVWCGFTGEDFYA